MLHATHIKSAAQAEGFSVCGIARATKVCAEREAERRAWLAHGEQGEMHYLQQNLDKRLDPRLLVEGAMTIVSVAANYYPGDWESITPALVTIQAQFFAIKTAKIALQTCLIG